MQPGLARRVPVSICGQRIFLRPGHVRGVDVSEAGEVEVSAVLDWATPSCWRIRHSGDAHAVELTLGAGSVAASFWVGEGQQFLLQSTTRGVHIEPIDPGERVYPADDVGGFLPLWFLVAVAMVAPVVLAGLFA